MRDLLFAENQLTKQGHISRGGFNLPLRRSFDIKDKKADFNLHVFEENDPEIELNILFRDYLRCSPEARSEYEKLKYQQLQKNRAMKN